MRRAALRSALSAKVAAGNVRIVDDFGLSEPKTKELLQVLNNLQAAPSALIVLPAPDQIVIKSARNLPGVKTTVARQLNVLDILSYEHLVITREALGALQEVFGE